MKLMFSSTGLDMEEDCAVDLAVSKLYKEGRGRVDRKRCWEGQVEGHGEGKGPGWRRVRRLNKRHVKERNLREKSNKIEENKKKKEKKKS